MNVKKDKRGFTLAELLIVVAIIAVLTGMGIPVFVNQLEKSREAVDLSNVRAAYAEVMSAAISQDQAAVYTASGAKIAQADGTYAVVVPLTQKRDGWQGTGALTVGGVNSTDTTHWAGSPKKEGNCRVSYSETAGVIFRWNGLTSLPGSAWVNTGGKVSYKSDGYSDYNANAVSELLEAKGGQQVSYTSLSDDPIIKAELDKGYVYQIGLYYLGSEQNSDGSYNVLRNTGEAALPQSGGVYTIQKGASGPDIPTGSDVKVAIQFFKYATNSSGTKTGKPIELTGPEEANALAGLFSIK